MKMKLTTGEGVIEFQSNSVSFELGGPPTKSLGFEFLVAKTPANVTLVQGWIDGGVDTVEATDTNGIRYELTEPGTATADFESHGENILVLVVSGRGPIVTIDDEVFRIDEGDGVTATIPDQAQAALAFGDHDVLRRPILSTVRFSLPASVRNVERVRSWTQTPPQNLRWNHHDVAEVSVRVFTVEVDLTGPYTTADGKWVPSGKLAIEFRGEATWTP